MTAVSTDLTVEEGIDSLESRNPSTGDLLGIVPVLGADAVEAVVSRARDAFATWGTIPHAQRRAHLLDLRRAIAKRVDDIADLIHAENGKPLYDAAQEVLTSVSLLDYAAKHAERVLAPRKTPTGLLANFRATVTWHPLGVVGVIGPWNYPLHTPMGSIAYALAAGNTVVFKPSELTPLVGRLLAEIADEALPIPHVLSVVTGDGRTGGALAAAALDKLAFTGSAATGRKVMAAAATRLTPVLMELGGKDPLIVAADADVDKAARAAVFGALTNAGQACVSIERAYVVAPVYDRFVEVAAEAASAVRTGPDGDIGAMTRPQQVPVIRAQVEDALAKGAKAIVGGLESIGDRFVEPIVLVGVEPGMTIMHEETFGPVLPIVRVADAEEAIRLANDSAFGLGSSVWGRSGVSKMADRIRAGMTAVNSVLVFGAIPSLPFGGIGESGFGRIHGDEGLREFSRPKATAEEKFSLPVAAIGFADNPDAMAKQTKGLVKAVFGGSLLDRAEAAVRRLRGN